MFTPLVASAFLLPATPQEPLAFTEEAVARGIVYESHSFTGTYNYGSGCALADLDNDGDLDAVVIGSLTFDIGLFENDGTGHFTNRYAASGLPQLLQPSAVIAFDYDGDADLDLYITQSNAIGESTNVLMRNDGALRFKDKTGEARAGDRGPSAGPSVGDYDGDGWLDLHVPLYGERDILFHNLGDGTFENQAIVQGVGDIWNGLQSVFFDMDWDGDADLFVSNDKRYPTETVMHNRLYENVGGNYVDVSATSGADENIYSMGVATGDFDEDGLQDLYCTNVGVEPNALMLSSGPGTFVRSDGPTGTGSWRTGWGATFLDYDNDTHQELYVCNMWSQALFPPFNRLYEHDGQFPAVDTAHLLDIDTPGDSFCSAVGDVDADGDQDILLPNSDEPTRLFINQEGQRRNWIRFDVVGEHPNHFAIGAHVEVVVGDRRFHREVMIGGNGYKSQNELTAHFGLGDATRIDELRVTWPGGERQVVLQNLGANQTHRILPRQPEYAPGTLQQRP